MALSKYEESDEDIEQETSEEEEKTFMTLAGLGAVFGFPIPLILWITRKQDFSDYAKKIFDRYIKL